MSGKRYIANPKRGCGTKVAGGYYAEGEYGKGGSLLAASLLFGDGLEGGTNCYASIPPRRMMIGNPAASLALSEFVSTDVPLDGLAESPGFEAAYRLAYQKLGGVALFDHVGSSHYTAHSFIQETVHFGPSRRIPPRLAKELAGHLPLPIIFTHSRVPVFRDKNKVRDVVRLAEDKLEWFSEPEWYGPTWMEPKWGMTENKDAGWYHYMRQTLALVDMLDSGSYTPAAIRDVFSHGVRFIEQPFLVSWITRIGYVPEADESPEVAWSKVAKSGIEVIDLKEGMDEPDAISG